MYVTIAYPQDETELILLRMHLEAAGIPFFIFNEYFGGLRPGVQIPMYNERGIQVLPEDAELVAKIVTEFRGDHVLAGVKLQLSSKLRMVLEWALAGWFVPGGRRRKNTNTNANTKNAETAAKKSSGEKTDCKGRTFLA